jgi:hypothetical protein
MIGRKILIVLACAGFLAACQTSSEGYAGRECAAEGKADGSQAHKNCVKATYAHDRAVSNRYAGGGP